MKLKSDYQPEFDSIKQLLLAMAQERSIDNLLDMIVTKMTEREHVAMSCIWLVKAGSECADCGIQEFCPEQDNCLQLAAIDAGKSINPDIYAKLERDLDRFPINNSKIGKLASSLETVVRLIDVHRDPEWQNIEYWARGEGALFFSGQPLVAENEILGVIGIFSRINRIPEGNIWLRMIANHFAISLTNARAFEEIESLKKQLELENEFLRDELKEYKNFGNIVGQSPVLSNTLKQVELVAPTDTNVLILGESGTGKELVAREIHNRSQRANYPMITVNCASIPKGLYESEFFGHVKGAFTGAVKDRPGRFEAANGGTLLLDEIGEVPLDMQTKLLRVLQEGLYERIGEDKTRKTNVRILASTNKNLKREVEKKRFRQDLYYRLNVFPIEIAPLRDRKEDIPLLADHFLKGFSKKLNRPNLRLSKANIIKLEGFSWPGNVRELQNIIERAVIISNAGKLNLSLPAEAEHRKPSYSNTDYRIDHGADIISEKEAKTQQRYNTLAALRKCRGKVYGKGGAAELLHIKPTTLSYRIKKMGISKKEIFN
jgi:transcriptional regulator with GAF, ATPase, and Fis domain